MAWPRRYTVEAYNVAEGVSARTSEIVRETDAITLRRVDAVADAYVDVAHPSATYGRSTSLRSDRDEEGATQRTYLRFVVPDLDGEPISALTLRVYGNSASNGQDVHPVPSTTWPEATTSWNNRPPASDPVVGAVLKSLARRVGHGRARQLCRQQRADCQLRARRALDRLRQLRVSREREPPAARDRDPDGGHRAPAAGGVSLASWAPAGRSPPNGRTCASRHPERMLTAATRGPAPLAAVLRPPSLATRTTGQEARWGCRT